MNYVRTFVRNELLFREVNERIYAIAASSTSNESLEVLCECGDDACITTLLIEVGDYRQVRDESSHFVVFPGHEKAEHERVIRQGPGYLVVEKVGAARAVIDDWEAGGVRRVSLER